MSAREDLAGMIHRCYCLERVHSERCTYAPNDHEAAEQILAAGWRPPARTIETVEELEALPGHSVVTRNGVPYTKNTDGWQIAGTWHVYSPESLLLNNNATVIYEPTA